MCCYTVLCCAYVLGPHIVYVLVYVLYTSHTIITCIHHFADFSLLLLLLFYPIIDSSDVIMLVAFAEIFGKQKIGELMGLVTACMTLGTVGGPVLGAIVMSSNELELCFYPMAIVAGLLGLF